MIIYIGLFLGIIFCKTGVLSQANITEYNVTEGITESVNFTEIISLNNFTEITENATTEDQLNTVTETSDYSNENSTDVCYLNPCFNGGSCVSNSDDDFTCYCPKDFVGKRCNALNKCELHDDGELCKNGACVYDAATEIVYCKCFPGTYWDSIQKECKRLELPCFPNPCKNSGFCNILSDITFNCTCPLGYEGNTCEIKNTCINDAEAQGCENGQCIFNEDNTIKYCHCYDDYFYDTSSGNCLISSPPCFPNPCEHEGQCANSTDNEFKCTCEKGFTGLKCDIKDNCPENGCGEGECVLYKEKKMQTCQCKEGYFIDEFSKVCRKIQPPCLPSPCKNNGLCISISDDIFNCSCIEGYSGKICSNRNMCELDGGIAFCKDANCVMNYLENTFYCECEHGEYYDYSQRKCTDLDMCPLMECGKYQECRKSECVCKHGYKRSKETKECQANYCGTYGCPSENMTCSESTGENPENYQCHCHDGYSFNGEKCVQASCLFPALNKCEQKCVPTNEGYECQCFSNHTLQEDGYTCERSSEIEECENDELCKHGVHVYSDSDSKCFCPSGYEEKNNNCLDICTSKSLPDNVCPNGMCEPVEGIGFRCQCSGKYQLSKDGATCALRSMCAKGELGYIRCNMLNAVCRNDFMHPEGYTCVCPENTAKDLTGYCSDPCEVNENETTCSRLGATCDLDIYNKAKCFCPNGFTSLKNGEPCDMLAKHSVMVNLPIAIWRYRSSFATAKSIQGIHSETMVYSAIQKDVSKSMMQLFEDFISANIIKCKIVKDFILCKTELQFETSGVEVSKRLALDHNCMYNETLSTKDCLIPPSLVLKREEMKTKVVTVTRTNICDEDIKADLCGDETLCSNLNDGENFMCSCKTGYTARLRLHPLKDIKTIVETCKDVNECEEENPCPKFMRCINTIGSYECACLNGYRPKENNTDRSDDGCIELCTPNPCIHGECHKKDQHKFQCNCDAGYRGELCNFEDKFYKDAKINTVIVGAVLGGILLITIILFITSVIRLRNKKYLDERSQILYAAEMTERSSISRSHVNAAFDKEN